MTASQRNVPLYTIHELNTGTAATPSSGKGIALEVDERSPEGDGTFFTRCVWAVDEGMESGDGCGLIVCVHHYLVHIIHLLTDLSTLSMVSTLSTLELVIRQKHAYHIAHLQ